MRQLLIISTLLFLSFCTHAPETSPDWIAQSVSNSRYWYGVGTGESRQSAREAAYNEIAAQISVQISSSFTRIITELNYDPSEYTQSIIHSRLTASLPEIEILRNEHINSLYYVQARLSKEKYYQSVALKRQAAVNKATDLLDMTGNELSANTFVYLTDALKQIVDYLDEDLKVTYPRDGGKQVNLYSYINSRILEAFNRISVEPLSDTLTGISGLPLENGIGVHCYDSKTGNPLGGIPLRAIAENTSAEYLFTSMSDGRGQFYPDTITEVGETIFQVTVNIEKLIPSILGRVTIPAVAKTDIPVSVRGLRVHFNSAEQNLGNDNEHPYVEPVIKKYFRENFKAAFADRKKADIIVKTSVSTSRRNSKPAEFYGQLVYQASADCTLSILEASGERELIQRSVNNIAGVSYNSFEDAGKDALKKLSVKIYEEIMPKVGTALSHK
ncbi:MAG: hypothetical protein GXO91_06600 [FCB group bacterium]|nr:hypothetical protein [FCB group bacterium]